MTKVRERFPPGPRTHGELRAEGDEISEFSPSHAGSHRVSLHETPSAHKSSHSGALRCGEGVVLGRVTWEASEPKGGAEFEERGPYFSSGSPSRSSENCSQLPSSPVPISYEGKSGAKSPWIWLSGAQKYHLGQMPAPCLPAGRLYSFLRTPRALICASASKTLAAANLVTWAVFVLRVSRA